jgi:hypothetical protein
LLPEKQVKDSNIRKEVIRRRQNDNAIAALGWTRRERWLGKAERQYGRGS